MLNPKFLQLLLLPLESANIRSPILQSFYGVIFGYTGGRKQVAVTVKGNTVRPDTLLSFVGILKSKPWEMEYNVAIVI